MLSPDRTPVDQTAARIIGAGEQYKCRKNIVAYDQDRPIPFRKPYRHEAKLVGLRSGRLTVLGLSEELRGRWVCQCDCGRYCIRRAKSIRNKITHDRCEVCRQKAYEKRHADWRASGGREDGFGRVREDNQGSGEPGRPTFSFPFSLFELPRIGSADNAR